MGKHTPSFFISHKQIGFILSLFSNRQHWMVVFGSLCMAEWSEAERLKTLVCHINPWAACQTNPGLQLFRHPHRPSIQLKTLSMKSIINMSVDTLPKTIHSSCCKNIIEWQSINTITTWASVGRSFTTYKKVFWWVLIQTFVALYVCCWVFFCLFLLLQFFWSTFYALQTAYSHSQLPQECEMLYLINQTTIVVLLSNCQQLGFETMFEVWLCNLWGRTKSLYVIITTDLISLINPKPLF